MRGCIAAAVALLLAAPAQAGDGRMPVDPGAPPWNAVAKVQTAIGGKCSGVLIAPAVVLTAAHCLYNHRTQAMLQPVSLHVLFGYERAQYRWHRLVARVAVGLGFDARRGPQAADWARLELAETVPVEPLPLAEARPVVGMAVALAGYNRDKAQLLMADLDCHLRGVAEQPDDALFLNHDCAGTFGTSGGPLLARHGDGWAVIGIAVAAGHGLNLALRPPLATLLADRPR